MINLISEQGEINRDVEAFPSASVNITIFGTQASGKSTLLNETFGSSFMVEDTQVDRGRCTKGVWLENTSNFNLLDTQGFDSCERTEDEKILEKQISLFCVALSDILLINMYVDEIGRYEGGHTQILEAIFKVGERLVIPHFKKIVFVVRDTTADIETNILRQQLTKSVTNLQNKHQNKYLKFNVECFFLSHYIYEPEKFREECVSLKKSMSIRKASDFNNYDPKDKVVYMRKLWNKIKDFENELDMKSLDDAIRSHVFERLKGQAIAELQVRLPSFGGLFQAKSYQKYEEQLRRIAFLYLQEHRPKHIKPQQIQVYSQRVYSTFEPTSFKHFNEVVKVSIEKELENQFEKEIDKHKNSKTLSSVLFKKRKEIIDHYKKIMAGHKEYSLLVKNFTDCTGQVIAKEQRKLSHLFSLFERAAENALNKEMDKQVPTLVFKPSEVNRKIKAICQEYKYQEWEIDFNEIWERVCNRYIEKMIPAQIEEQSRKSVAYTRPWSGDQTTQIIAKHMQLEKKTLDFCRDILQFLNQDNTLSEPLDKIKATVHQCLDLRLQQEQRRFKVSLFLLCLLLLLVQGEMESFLQAMGFKKKKRRFWMRLYWYGSVALLAYSLYKPIQRRFFSHH